MSLVGREAALALGDAALADVRSARGRVLLVAGEAGIGKTTLAREIARRAEAAGAVLRWASCFEGASLLPYAVWVDCLRHPGDDPCAAMAARLDG
ncbi:MAG: ATP-binding protein, partial [Acidimicrobiales bacterium]